MSIAKSIIHPQDNRLNSIASSILSGVISNQHAGLGSLITLAKMGDTLDKILQLTNRFSKDFTRKLFEKEKVWYRGAKRNLGQIPYGFEAHGTNMNLKHHAIPASSRSKYQFFHPKSGLVSSTTLIDVALSFPMERGLDTTFIHEIIPSANAIDVEKVLGPKLQQEGDILSLKMIQKEKEMAFRRKIPLEQIKGTWETFYNMKTMRRGVIPSSFKINPHYGPEQLWRLEKNIGKVMTAFAVINDAERLYNAYQDSHILGNYKPLAKEGIEIAFGWGGAISMGSAGAMEAAALCGSFGPYVVPVCAFAGGIAGSFIGYNAGEKAADALISLPAKPFGDNKSTFFHPMNKKVMLWDINLPGHIHGSSFFNRKSKVSQPPIQTIHELNLSNR